GGGTINLSAAGNVRLTTLTGFGSVNGAASIAVVSNLSVGGPLNVGTLNLGGNFTPVNAFPIAFDLGATNTTGAGVNDYLSVNGDVNFSNNPVVLNLNAPLLSGSNYSLVGFTGARNGLLTFTNNTRSASGLDQSTPGHVD